MTSSSQTNPLLRDAGRDSGRETDRDTSHDTGLATALAPPNALIKVDLDDRSFVFPAAKAVTQLQLLVYRRAKLRIELAYGFNEAHHATEFAELHPDAVPELARKLVEAAYRASSFLLVAGEFNVSFVTHPNGYTLQIGDFASQRDLFISPPAIWRVASAFCRAADFFAVSAQH